MRGIAALLVLAQHVLSYVEQPWAARIIETVDLGKLGVTLFFLISGFVIPFSFKHGMRAFWIGRAFRLLPALWISMLFAIALGAPVESAWQIVANGLMITYTTGQTKLVDPYWTLNLELYFYAIVAIWFAAGHLHKPMTLGLLAVVCSLASLKLPYMTYLVFMFTGTLLRMFLLERMERSLLWLAVALWSLVMASALWATKGRYPTEFFAALALSLPLFLALWNRPINWLIGAGAISYSLYLFHLPIIEALARYDLSPWAMVVAGIVLPVSVAICSYKWVEQPMLAWGRLMQRQGGRSDAPRSVPYSPSALP